MEKHYCLLSFTLIETLTVLLPCFFQTQFVKFVQHGISLNNTFLGDAVIS